ncbi:RraA family protein [Pandoraea pulmonicola]|uniref:Putative 4-hydroxy-4-methyl-2-oxoglutarate aldolase n=1 Tax=Pandoraea pulmonicola TaxID=93221 RepID=A0AAJ5D196_PANPU|nr:dimethylmenaquinone methyltransferase [Pandoraea pulmonicola]AJC20157.1 dimethylmenaquinone methyltransferase [Pandoraea pulmonicola]SUA91523.1 4-hydroxy-2-oxoglutarate aldolase [Pandoraea pulmonicola]
MNACTDAVSRLRKLDACAVSDALDKLGLPSTVSHLPQRAGSRRIAGRAVTVKLVAAADAPPSTGAPRHLGTTAVMLAGADDIIVVEQRTGLDAGSWGGILSLAAVQRGIAGIVADGPVRDIDEARDYDLPVFCRALTARTARGRVAEAGTNVAINVDGFTVAPGDYVIADNSAVVFVSAADIDRVLAAAEQIAAREAAMAKSLLAGQPVTEVMGANYEHMLHDAAA